MTLEEAQLRYPGAKAMELGDSRSLSDALIALVRTGFKTATTGALRDYGPGGEAMSEPGQHAIVLNWDGGADLAIEITEVTVRRFDEVPLDFALAEGEDDTLEEWRSAHRLYFERNGGWSEDMEVVCERFRVVEDFT